MRLIHSLLVCVRRRLREQDGLVMLYALAATLVVLGSSAAAFAAIDNDLPLSRADSSEKQAYSAAQAGIQRYVYELDENSEYWTQCVPSGANWIFNTGKPMTPQPVPGSSSEKYAVMLLPAAGQSTYKSCSQTDPVDSMVQESGNGAGSIRISSTGYAGGLTRTIVASLREQSFLDYAWFTDYETADPSQQVAENSAQDPTLLPPDLCAAESNPPSGCGTNYDTALAGANAQCAQYRYGQYSRDGDNAAGYGKGVFFKDQYGSYNCQDIEFVTGDSINGPFHSNDSVLVCGTPSFGTSLGDSIEFGGPSPGWVGAGCGGDRPTIDGNPNGTASQSQIIKIPQTNTLGPLAQGPWSFQGTTCITLTTTGVNVATTSASYPSCFSPGLVSKPVTGPDTVNGYPANGVLYVNNSSSLGCSLTYDVDDPVYTGNIGCGTVYVSGVDSQPLTIGSDDDIVIDGNLTYKSVNNSDPILGLVATNFVRVYHPIGPNQPTQANTSQCNANSTNAGGSLVNPTIDAMILSLNHSFIVDQYDCGAKLGTLTVNGGIAQEFRGTVGTGSGGAAGTGYLKNYNYDPRLRYEEPPHFLTPVEGAWKVARETECNQGAAACDSTTLS